MKLHEVIRKLDYIASRNDDEFSYRIEIDRSGWHFVATETADGHDVFGDHLNVLDVDTSIEEEDIESSLEDFGYEIE
jgi:hypothetical protein